MNINQHPASQPMNLKFTIKLERKGMTSVWAQDRSKTFDYSFSVLRREDAKKFNSIPAAQAWLKRQGLADVHGQLLDNPVFVGWEISCK